MANFLYKEPCPKCRAKGNDNSGDNLAVYDDGSLYCFSCSFSKQGNSKISQAKNSTQLPMYTTEAILGKRSISAKVIKDYSITTEVDENTNEVQVKFPLHDTNAVEANAQYRGVDLKTGELGRDISFSTGKLKLPCMGWQLVKPTTKRLIICEGLTDTLILASNYTETHTVCIGLTSASSAKRLASHILSCNQKFLITLAFDNDDAGKLANDSFVQTIEKHDSSIIINKLSIPKQYKDVGDWVKDGGKGLKEEADNPSPISLDGIIGSAEIGEAVLEYFADLCNDASFDLSFAPTLSNAVSFIPRKLIGILGSSGQGKSTLVEHIAMEAIQQRKNVLFVSREMTPGEVGTKLLRMVTAEPLANKKYVMGLSEERKQELAKHTSTITKLLNMTSGFGSINIDNISKQIHKLTAANRHPSIVIIDHLLAIVEGSEAGNLMEACKQLKNLAKDHNTCVIILTHTSKLPKGRGIQQPTLDSAYGSSGLPIYADVVLSVASDKETGITMVETVKYERMGGMYANITLNFKDYVLSEATPGTKANYTNEEEQKYDTEEFY